MDFYLLVKLAAGLQWISLSLHCAVTAMDAHADVGEIVNGEIQPSNLEVLGLAIHSFIILVDVVYVISIIRSAELRSNAREWLALVTVLIMGISACLQLSADIGMVTEATSWLNIHHLCNPIYPIHLGLKDAIGYLMVAIMAEHVTGKLREDYTGISKQSAIIIILTFLVSPILLEAIILFVVSNGLIMTSQSGKVICTIDPASEYNFYLYPAQSFLAYIALLVATILACNLRCRKNGKEEKCSQIYAVSGSAAYLVLQMPWLLLTLCGYYYLFSPYVEYISYYVLVSSYAVVPLIWMICHAEINHTVQETFCHWCRSTPNPEKAELLHPKQ